MLNNNVLKMKRYSDKRGLYDSLTFCLYKSISFRDTCNCLLFSIANSTAFASVKNEGKNVE